MSRASSPRAGGDGEIVVRRASAGDIDAVHAIEREAFTDPWPRSSFLEALESPHLYFSVVVTADGHLVGYLLGWFAAGDGEIANIAVASGARGRGIGGRLLDDAILAAQAAGAVTIHLEVRESNAAAQALYASRRFTSVGRRRGYYREPPEDAIVLRRTFGAPPVIHLEP